MFRLAASASSNVTRTKSGLQFWRSINFANLPMPALSPTMTKGNLATWRKKVGDRIRPGDVLAEIETDKATLEFEAQEEGYLAKILVPGGSSDVPVGQAVAIIVENADDISKVPADAGVAAPAAAAPEAPKPAPTPAPSAPAPAAPKPAAAPAAPYTIPLSPAVRHLVESAGLDPALVAQATSATGRGGRLTKGDVLAAMEKGVPLQAAPKPAEAPKAAPAQPKPTAAAPAAVAAAPVGDQPYEEIPNSQIRKIIAQRLTESKQMTPHFYVSAECRIDGVLALRKMLKEQLNTSVSVNDFVVKASALALRQVKAANCVFDKEPKLSPTVDISIAVATDKGLITPIVKNADQMGVAAISGKIKELAGKARDGKLKPEEFQGGSFSISNLGMFGIDVFSAVINPPQGCILAVGTSNSKVVLKSKGTKLVDLDSAEPSQGPVEESDLEVVTTMSVTLSADRRMLDEAEAAQFVQAFQKNIENAALAFL